MMAWLDKFYTKHTPELIIINGEIPEYADGPDIDDDLDLGEQHLLRRFSRS